MNKQPNSRHCFVCGIESPVGLGLHFYDNGIDEVHSRYTVRQEYNGYPGVVHGGIVAAMLDEAGGRAMMIQQADRFMMTATMSVRYRRPVPVEIELTLIGRIVKDRGRLAQAHSEIRLPDGSLCAEAEITLVAFPAQLPSDLAALGWKVYPEESPPD